MEAKDDSNILLRDRHLSDGHMKRVCLGPPSLDETSDKWPIDHDVAQVIYTIKSCADHVWTNAYIHPPHTYEGFHLLSMVEYFLKLQATKKQNLLLIIYKLHVTTRNIN